MDNVLTEIGRHRVIPVVEAPNVEVSLPLADALIQGELPVIEVTFRTRAAREVISRIARERPEMILGAGTILSVEELVAAWDNGAKFGVAPGFNPDVVAKAAELGMPFMPGVATPTDIESALRLDCKLLKLFPAEALGGVAYLRAIAAPYRHRGVKFMPSGGLNISNVASWLAMDCVFCAGGTWIAGKDAVSAGRWDEITENCRALKKVLG
ncbi:MAG: bifunctional 4-hydroxy-2-oxoglutarate aldolase/2-dehydro-3-deoxy-phosphogluconate aldolase [Candidatus Sumerlaeota bacterium]|nr:bifunctional 4-hydroxy-2-oxoglutarate aldolase/2-dehydro-3-deoxy-phosphogluconate aldolase [Candidatus Sumerlaeota bacterium]